MRKPPFTESVAVRVAYTDNTGLDAEPAAALLSTYSTEWDATEAPDAKISPSTFAGCRMPDGELQPCDRAIG